MAFTPNPKISGLPQLGANKVHKYMIGKTFGVQTCESDFLQLYMLRLMDKVYSWNVTEDYLTEEELRLLEGKILTLIYNC